MIALTANAIVGAKETYLAAGFDDYLSKPIEIPKLEELLLRYLPKDVYDDDVEFTSPSSAEDAVTAQSTESEPKGSDVLEFSPDEPGKVALQPEFIKNLSAKGIDVEAGLTYAADDPDFYLELLKTFVGEAAEKTAAIRSNYATKNIQDYRILVHSLKSSAKTIGASELSSMALEQEKAAKSNDLATIDAGMEKLVTEYEKTVDVIRFAISE